MKSRLEEQICLVGQDLFVALVERTKELLIH